MLLIILVLVSGLLIGGYMFWTQNKHKKALIGRKLATILAPSGERMDKLLPVEGNQIWDEVQGRKFPYMVRPDKGFDVWWPPGKLRLLQVSVKSFLYAEGNPEPIDPFDRPPVITVEVLGNLQNINFSRAMVGRTEEIARETEALRKPKIPMWAYIVGGVVLLILVGIILMIVS